MQLLLHCAALPDNDYFELCVGYIDRLKISFFKGISQKKQQLGVLYSCR